MPTEKNIKRLIISFLVLFLIGWLLTGCSVEKKSQRKVAYLIAHDKLGEYCNLLYPPGPDSIITRDTTIIDTVPGPRVTIRDTIKCKDSLIYREHECPPGKTIIKTVLKDTTIYRDNPNQRAAYEQQLREKDKLIKDKEGVIAAKDEVIIKQQEKIEALDKWKIYFIILCSLNVLAFVVRFFVIKRPI